MARTSWTCKNCVSYSVVGGCSNPNSIFYKESLTLPERGAGPDDTCVHFNMNKNSQIHHWADAEKEDIIRYWSQIFADVDESAIRNIVNAVESKSVMPHPSVKEHDKIKHEVTMQRNSTKGLSLTAKIELIKYVRAIAGSGLKDAKEAVEYVLMDYDRPYVSAEILHKLNKEIVLLRK